MQQGDTVTTVWWKETKPPWSHCVRWLLQETSFEVQKAEMPWQKPRVKPPSGSPCFERPSSGPAPCGMAAREKAAGLHRALCKPHQHHQRLCKHRTHLCQGLISPHFCHHLYQKHFSCSAGTPLGHNSLKPFLKPRWESEMKKCLFHSTHHTDRLAQLLESTSCPNKQKHRETSGLGKQFRVSWDANSLWKYKGHLQKN